MASSRARQTACEEPDESAALQYKVTLAPQIQHLFTASRNCTEQNKRNEQNVRLVMYQKQAELQLATECTKCRPRQKHSYSMPASLSVFRRCVSTLGQGRLGSLSARTQFLVKHGSLYTSSRCIGGGASPNTISQERSSKSGFIVRGSPNVSVKNVCVGICKRQLKIRLHCERQSKVYVKSD